MKFVKDLNITTSQLLGAIVGGLALFLVPQDAKNILSGVFRQFYVMGIATLVVFLLFLIFKSYKTIGLSLMFVMILTVIQYVIYNINLNSVGNFKFYINYYDGICSFLLWLIPFSFCLFIRIFSNNTYSRGEFKDEFKYFMKSATIAFFIYYLILFLACFIFVNPIDFLNQRDIDFSVFPTISANVTFKEIEYYVWDFIFFVPLGFFVAVYKPQMEFWKRILIPLIFGFFIESVQLILNTSSGKTVDVLLYIVGFMGGMIIKILLDRLRSFVTRGEEISIFEF